MNAAHLYLRLPGPLQSALMNAYGYRLKKRRYGGDYERLEREVFERERYGREELHRLSCRRVQSIVRHAVDTVPYYRQLFAELAINPEEIRSPEDLRQLPVLDKSTVQARLADFESDLRHRMRCSTVHTSGTSGTGLVFPMTLEAEREQWAIWWRYRARFGISRETWYAHFYGRFVVPMERAMPPFWSVNHPGRQIFFSGYHLNEAFLPHYVDELNRRKPAWIQGYPSLLAVLASHLVDRSLRLDFSPRVVTTGAETLLAHQKALIEEAFGAPCRQHYGMVEAVGNISECPEGSLHVDEDFGHLEFLPLGDEDGACRIIGTGFANEACPLIRYDTGDVAVPADPDERCPCGRPGRLVRSIDGRIEDYVVTPDGRRIGRLDHIFKGMTAIKECQIVQERQDSVLLKVVRRNGYGEEHERLLLKEAQSRLGSLRIDLAYVDAIERTSRAKLRLVVSKLPEGKLDYCGSERHNARQLMDESLV
ncbi:MAG: phenylacetate--CoA ligase family protein [Syntrophobacteraceae bacterium]